MLVCIIFCTKCRLFAPGSHHCAQARETCSITQQRGVGHILSCVYVPSICWIPTFASSFLPRRVTGWTPLNYFVLLHVLRQLNDGCLVSYPPSCHGHHVHNHFVHNTFALHNCFGQKYFGCLVSYPPSWSPPAATWEKAMLCSTYITSLTMSIVHSASCTDTQLPSLHSHSLNIHCCTDAKGKVEKERVGEANMTFNLRQKIDWDCGDVEIKAGRGYWYQTMSPNFCQSNKFWILLRPKTNVVTAMLRQRLGGGWWGRIHIISAHACLNC